VLFLKERDETENEGKTLVRAERGWGLGSRREKKKGKSVLKIGYPPAGLGLLK